MPKDRPRTRAEKIAKSLQRRAIKEESLRRSEWSAACVAAAEEHGPRIQRLLEQAEQLLAHEFFAAAIVAAFTALEVCSTEIAIKTAFFAITWPFSEMANYLESSIFGRNGKLQNLRRLLETGLALDYPAKEHWDKLAEVQDLRNQIIHEGEEASKKSAQRAVTAVRVFVDEMLIILTGGRLKDWAG